MLHVELCPGIVVEKVDGEFVIMNTFSADVYTLNSSAALLWGSLFEGPEASVESLTSLGFSKTQAVDYYDIFVSNLIDAGIVKCSTS